MKTVSLKQSPKKFVTRCSSLPLLFSCSNAILNPDKLTAVRVENGAENLGTDIHAAIQHTIETGEVDFRKIELRYENEDVERAKWLFASGLKVVEEARRDMKNPQFEQEISFDTERFTVTGHVDLLDVQDKQAFVVDFKTGRTRDDHYHQMLGYAVGVWSRLGRPAGFVVHVAYVYLENNEVTNFDATAADMAAWIKELDGLPDRYTINRRCIYCPFNNTCPAFRDYLKGSLTMLLEVSRLPTVNVRKLTDAARSKLATNMKMMQFAVDRIRDFIKQDAIKNGDIDIGNGDRFVITQGEHKTVISSRALPILAKYVTSADLAKATKLNLNDLLHAAGSRAKGGVRAALRDDLLKKLMKAGAVVVTPYATLRTANKKGSTWPKKKPSSTPPKKSPSSPSARRKR